MARWEAGHVARDEMLRVRVDAASFERWKEAAADHNSLSDFVREAVEAHIAARMGNENEMATLGRRVVAMVAKLSDR